MTYQVNFKLCFMLFALLKYIDCSGYSLQSTALTIAFVDFNRFSRSAYTEYFSNESGFTCSATATVYTLPTDVVMNVGHCDTDQTHRLWVYKELKEYYD